MSEFDFFEQTINRPGMFGIRDSYSFYMFYHGIELINEFYDSKHSKIIDIYKKLDKYCNTFFVNSREIVINSLELISIYCNYYEINEYHFRKFLMAKFLKEEYNYDVSYEYEVFEIQDVEKPFEGY